MFMGLGVVPKAGDPFVDMIDLRQLHGHFVRVRATRTVAAMPDHTDYIARRVAADPVPGSAQRAAILGRRSGERLERHIVEQLIVAERFPDVLS